MSTASVVHDSAKVVHEHGGLHPIPHSKSLTTGPDEYLTVQPYKGGWIVSTHGAYAGSVKKLKAGWKIEPLGITHAGSAYEACKRATELLDERERGEKSARPGAHSTLKDHVHVATSVPGVTSPEIHIPPEAAAGNPQGGCCTPTVLAKEGSEGGAPTLEVARGSEYNACLEAAAKLGQIKTTKRVYEVVRSITDVSDQEILLVVPLDARYQLRGGVVPVHKGARASVHVSTVEVMRAVVVTGASHFVLVHSHPSGKAGPSSADRQLTKHVERATKVMGEEVVMLDHVVVARREYYSIREDKLYKVK